MFCLALAAPAHATRGLDLGLTDGLFESSDPGTRSTWLDHTVDARADDVILGAVWRSIAPANPLPGFEPSNPNDPEYSWGTLDAAVQGATSRGLKVTIVVTQAPDWAEGRHRHGNAPAGTWKPSPKKLKAFAKAIAKRYEGQVRHFQLWAEPNLSTYLTPQWRHGHPIGPLHYRKMLNAFYAGVHSVDMHDEVLTGGTAPYGDPGTGSRMQPAMFWRTLLCLKGHKLATGKCPKPAHFDIAAHNPINVGKPTRHALNRDDISTPDIGKLKRILRRAQHTRRALPKGKKPIWATEIWWDSKPPDPNGIPSRRHARWLEEALYVLWKQGVKSVTWFQIRDQAPNPNYSSTFQTGLFLLNGSPKPAYRAFRFPFVGDRAGRHRVRLWGEAPGAGDVTVQRKRHGGWHTIKHLHAGPNRVFTGKAHLSGKVTLRVRSQGETSLAWKVH
jgi:hypothetical protein